MLHAFEDGDSSFYIQTLQLVYFTQNGTKFVEIDFFSFSYKVLSPHCRYTRKDEENLSYSNKRIDIRR